jgi:hypothetical protein
VKLLYRSLGFEIAFVQIGHGLIGAALLGLLAASVPWWFLLALSPIVVFSFVFWMYESRLALPVARELLAGREWRPQRGPISYRKDR